MSSVDREHVKGQVWIRELRDGGGWETAKGGEGTVHSDTGEEACDSVALAGAGKPVPLVVNYTAFDSADEGPRRAFEEGRRTRQMLEWEVRNQLRITPATPALRWFAVGPHDYLLGAPRRDDPLFYETKLAQLRFLDGEWWAFVDRVPEWSSSDIRSAVAMIEDALNLERFSVSLPEPVKEAAKARR